MRETTVQYCCCLSVKLSSMNRGTSVLGGPGRGFAEEREDAATTLSLVIAIHPLHVHGSSGGVSHPVATPYVIIFLCASKVELDLNHVLEALPELRLLVS